MKDELTTLMHSEFLKNEIGDLDIRIMGACGAMRRGVNKEKALSQYKLTEKTYNDNINRVLSI